MKDVRIGQKLGNYTITEKIGQGGMAEVYKAYQKNLDRYVAVKMMHPHLVQFEEKNFFKRFQHEARAMATLNHPHIIRVYDFDTFNHDNHYIVMDYINGGSLKEHLGKLADNNERMPLERSIEIIKQVADALAYAHARDMVHRDIKPANILLDETGQPYLTDFGIVKMIGGETMGLTMTGAIIGTPTYMSPEQAMGNPGDKRSDIYSLGIMFFQMVTGKLPFDADTPLAVVMKHVNEPVPLPITFNPDVPQELQSIIMRALAKEPNGRFQTAEAMASALRRFDALPSKKPTISDTIHSTEILSPPTIITTPPPTPSAYIPSTPTPTTQIQKRRWPWFLLAGIVFLLLAAISAAVILPKLGFNLAGFGDESTPTALVGATATFAPQPTTAVPTNTPQPADTPNTTESISVIASQTATTEVPTAVSTNTKTPAQSPTLTPTTQPTQSPTPTATPTSTPTQEGNSTGTAHTGGGVPLLFETFGTWVRGDEDNGSITQSSAQVHGGSNAAKLSYNFDSSDNDYVVFMQLNSISGSPNTLQIWVYGDGSGHFFNAWIVDNEGETWQVPMGRITHTGWQQMTGYIATGQDWPWGHISGPSNETIDYPITFRGFVLDDVNNAYTGQGIVYLDDLTTTTANAGTIPTIQPVASPAATAVATTVIINPGNVGRILYTSGNALLTTDPDWTSPVEIGTSVSNSCNSPATTVDGQSYNLYFGNYCGIGATGTGVCASPNGTHEVVTNHVDGAYSIVVRPSGTNDLQFVYQGTLNLIEGIRWSPQSDSFLFVIDSTVYRAFPGGNYNTIIPTGFTPTFSPDGSLILYRKPVGPGVNDIFVSNADGSNPHNVTNAPAIDKQCAVWRN